MLVPLIAADILLGVLAGALICSVLAMVRNRHRRLGDTEVDAPAQDAPEPWVLRLKAAYDAGYYKTEADCERQSPLPWHVTSCQDSTFRVRFRPLLFTRGTILRRRGSRCSRPTALSRRHQLR
jgi:hypothetical protein